MCRKQGSLRDSRRHQVGSILGCVRPLLSLSLFWTEANGYTDLYDELRRLQKEGYDVDSFLSNKEDSAPLLHQFANTRFQQQLENNSQLLYALQLSQYERSNSGQPMEREETIGE